MAKGSKAEGDRDVHAGAEPRGSGILRPGITDACVELGCDQNAVINCGRRSRFEES